METPQINMQDSPAVQKWLESLRKRSGEEISLHDERVKLVKGFCEYVGKTPDEVVDYCWLRNRKDDVAANTIRSFLIHNGVFMAGTAFRG
jgi:RNase H-fold protein (predicted Holliday junction resolvase)